jgi:hypothetical protein
MMTSIASPARSQRLNVKKINRTETAAATIATVGHDAVWASTAMPGRDEEQRRHHGKAAGDTSYMPKIGERLVSNGMLAGARGSHTATCKGHARFGGSPPEPAHVGSRNSAASGCRATC